MTALLVLVVTASVAPAPVAGGVAAAGSTDTATTRQASEYAGTYVSFDAGERAVTDYAVRGEEMLDSVRVASERSVENGSLADLDAGLSAVTEIEGAGLDFSATSRTEATVAAETGATLTAHDNPRGLFVVAGSDESNQSNRSSQQSNRSNQSNYVVADLAAGANATADGDSRVEVTTENGTEATFLVVGAGEATVTDEGDVTARLGEGGLLVFRAYPDGKDDRDEKQEALIAEGTATAEAYVMVENTTTVVDTVSYGANTTVETTETAVGEVTVAVSRTTDEGTILLTSVSERALAAADLEVAVDGEAAAEARTYTQLKSALGSDRSRYVVERTIDAGKASASADASADVLIAVNRFSERTVSIASASASEPTTGSKEATGGEETTGGETTTDTGDSGTNETTTDAGERAEESGGETATATVVDDETGNGAGVPGFTASAALLALVAAAMLARLR